MNCHFTQDIKAFLLTILTQIPSVIIFIPYKIKILINIKSFSCNKTINNKTKDYTICLHFAFNTSKQASFYQLSQQYYRIIFKTVHLI